MLVNSNEPTGVLFVRSVRTSFANRTAPSMLTSPAPCSNMLAPASGCAVYIRIALTMFGVRPGFACSNRAAAPATIGVAIDVPLSSIMSLSPSLMAGLSSEGLAVTR